MAYAAYITKDGRHRTAAQIEAAFAACRTLELAYEVANPDNGGGGNVDWSNVDDARGWAQTALHFSEQLDIVDQARDDNGVGD